MQKIIPFLWFDDSENFAGSRLTGKVKKKPVLYSTHGHQNSSAGGCG